MDPKSKHSKRREDVLSTLNAVIDGLNVAGNVLDIMPAKAVFSTVSVILTMIRDSMINHKDYVDLGFTCDTICTALSRGLKEKQLSELGGSVVDAISQLTTTLAEIRSKVAERSKQNAALRAFHAKNDSKIIAGWGADLNRILLVFDTELELNTYVAVSDVRDGVTKIHTAVSEVQRGVTDTYGVVTDIRQLLESREAVDEERRSNQTGALGESPPSVPRACFGRDELVEKIVGLAKGLTPIALIGAGGIGKTSISLTVLHHDHIKQRFGPNRRFIRCDQFPASCTHLLGRLSQVIGAGIENPKDLASLLPFLSSSEMFIVLDNAESILDPLGPNADDIYAVVEELSHLKSICLCVTSRISTIPPYCETVEVPILSIKAAREAFYRICKNISRSDLADEILVQLGFHPLSITLLATVAYQHKWSMGRLSTEWEKQRTGMLQTMHNRSFATTIELSLASPMFQGLGPDARALLEVVAFFPQGVDENQINWLFPTISNGAAIFDKFCVLSLTYRNDSFITMLAPLRDHLRPKDPKSSSLLRSTKERYFTRMSVEIDPTKPEYKESQWITSEDANVEHLLDVFTTIDANSGEVWEACAKFMEHLFWHKKRLVILEPKIEGLPDDHRSKPNCLFELSRLFQSIGNHAERKRLLTRALELWRERGNDRAVARVSRHLSQANRHMGLYEEGIKMAEEASGILERLGDSAVQARCLIDLAWLLHANKQFDAAEEAASRAIHLFPETGEEYRVCGCHRLLGYIYRFKDDTEKAVQHYKSALGIASSFDWHNELYQGHCGLARMFLEKGRFVDAQEHVEQAKLHTLDHTYHLGHVIKLQARLWQKQHRLDEAKSEALRAADIYRKLGAENDLKLCRALLRRIEGEMDKLAIHDDPGDDGQVTESEH